MSNDQHPLRYLDGVRGLAALIVVLHHFGLTFIPAINFLDPSKIHFMNGGIELFIAKTPFNLFFNGGFAVSIFFVLSGMVLSYKFHRTGDRTILTHYALKRYFRLFLPVAIIIIACFILEKSGLFYSHFIGDMTKSKDWLHSLFSGIKDPLDMLRNLTFDVFLNNDNRYNPVLWTMTIEFLGSLLLFAFLAIIGTHRHTVLLHVLLASVLLLTTQKYYAAFVLGSLLCYWLVNGVQLPKNKTGMFCKMSLIVLGIYFSTFPQGMFTSITIWKYLEWVPNGHDFFHVLGAFFIMIVLANSAAAIRFFTQRPFIYLGKISFSLYLVHFPVLCSLGCWVFLLSYHPENYSWAITLSFIVTLVISGILAHLYQKYIDQRGIQLADSIAKRF